MKALLGTQDVMDIVEDGYEEAPSKEDEASMSDAQRTSVMIERVGTTRLNPSSTEALMSTVAIKKIPRI
ncbi:hypothetical protein OIU84_003474 [Salix udensis]|uniref:Uncharacterized protein n=1 Tax=Salix udensis TaxID=889485 RepID=A0AAD6K1Y8_9ROSI|nr:hypothetical protein OIU84_003474 [Salix udensis]